MTAWVIVVGNSFTLRSQVAQEAAGEKAAFRTCGAHTGSRLIPLISIGQEVCSAQNSFPQKRLLCRRAHKKTKRADEKVRVCPSICGVPMPAAVLCCESRAILQTHNRSAGKGKISLKKNLSILLYRLELRCGHGLSPARSRRFFDIFPKINSITELDGCISAAAWRIGRAGAALTFPLSARCEGPFIFIYICRGADRVHRVAPAYCC